VIDKEVKWRTPVEQRSKKMEGVDKSAQHGIIEKEVEDHSQLQGKRGKHILSKKSSGVIVLIKMEGLGAIREKLS